MNSGKLILVRHGLSVYNDQNRFTGWKDVDLNEQGITEAKQAVDLLEDVNFDMAFTSKLKRANDTLNLILKGIGQESIHIEKDLALNERDYGDLVGQNKAEAAKKFGVPDSQMLLVEGEVGILAAMKAGRADAAVQTFFGAKEHEEKTGGAFEVTDPKLMPKETVNVVGIGFRKSDNEFREAFNAALAKVLANPAKMLERAGKYGYDKAQLPPADMTTEWACSTK